MAEATAVAEEYAVAVETGTSTARGVMVVSRTPHTMALLAVCNGELITSVQIMAAFTGRQKGWSNDRECQAGRAQPFKDPP